MKNCHERRLRDLWPLLFFFLLSIHGGLCLPAAAHEKEHAPTEGMSEHMSAMREVKESIPAEYRIMDRTPVAPTKQSLERGRNLYMENCAVCHGEKGKGDGPAAAGMNPPPANFLDVEHSAIYGPGEKYWIVGHGSPKTGMPGFPSIKPMDRWHLVNYILSLQENSSRK